jgi:hypothetical protein
MAGVLEKNVRRPVAVEIVCVRYVPRQTLRARGPAPMKPSALRIERLLAKVEAELACSARPRRYCFDEDEIEEAEAQGLPYVLAPRVLSREEWVEQYSPRDEEAQKNE